MRLQNRSTSVQSFKPLELREISLLDSARRRTTGEGMVLLEPQPRVPRSYEALPAGGKIDLTLLFGQKGAPASLEELRLAMPRAKGYFFLLVDGS
ncbi:MAG TPA: hypothetical protein VGK67_18795 [Myxococcales bacterium]